MYMERSVWEAIESYHPIEGDFDELLKLIDLVAEEVIQIKLNNLIPNCFGTPRKPVEDKIPDAYMKYFYIFMKHFIINLLGL